MPRRDWRGPPDTANTIQWGDQACVVHFRGATRLVSIVGCLSPPGRDSHRGVRSTAVAVEHHSVGPRVESRQDRHRFHDALQAGRHDLCGGVDQQCRLGQGQGTLALRWSSGQRARKTGVLPGTGVDRVPSPKHERLPAGRLHGRALSRRQVGRRQAIPRRDGRIPGRNTLFPTRRRSTEPRQPRRSPAVRFWPGHRFITHRASRFGCHPRVT